MAPSSSSISDPDTDGSLELSDGRTLGYAAYGPAEGDPLFFFHGTPGSRYTRVPDASILDDHGVRQITLERPGFGRSAYDPDRELLDWPDDVSEAADTLGYDRFAVAGESGGGPFTLACAARIPERLTGVGVIGGMGRIGTPDGMAGMEWKNRLGFKLARLPYVLRPLLWLRIRKIRNDTEGFLDAWAESGAAADRGILQRPEVRAVFRQAFPEAVRQGTKAPLTETKLLVRPWEFDFGDISVPVDLWHGEQDTFVPLSMAEHTVDRIPSCTAHIYPDEGHLLHYRYWDEILPTLQR